MRIRPLTLAAVGVALAAVDLRLVAWDVLPDALGWLLIAVAAHRIGMRAPAVLAGLAAVGSAAEVALPYYYQSIDRITGAIIEHPEPGTDYAEELVFEPLTGVRLLGVVGAVALGGVALTLMLLELRRRARTTPDTQSTQRLEVLAWLVPSVWIAPLLLVAAGEAIVDGEADPVWNGSLELLALPGVLVAVVLGVFLALTANRRWSASGDEVGSPWAEMMVRSVAP